MKTKIKFLLSTEIIRIYTYIPGDSRTGIVAMPRAVASPHKLGIVYYSRFTVEATFDGKNDLAGTRHRVSQSPDARCSENS
jgi:hypothetical protein